MEAEVKRLARRRDGGDSEEERRTKKTKNKSQLEEELAKYEKGRGVHRKGRKKDESEVLAAIAGFRNKLQMSVVARDKDEEPDDWMGDAEPGAQEHATEEDTNTIIEVDSDQGFMGHVLEFPKGNEEEVQKAEREYEVIDPRARGAQAREEELKRKRAAAMKRGRGRRGRR
jgi:peptidyl-prolyl cis-trans isomerase SDCCAG10